MQSQAEKILVATLTEVIKTTSAAPDKPRILNIGAGRSISIERQLMSNGCSFISDRIDITDCHIHLDCIGECMISPAENMQCVQPDQYIAAFANFVFEHVEDIKKASCEAYRILRPNGYFIASIPNPSAPEFIFARYTPLWFHKFIRGSEAWETHYSYNTIAELTGVFEEAGFQLISIRYAPCVQSYLDRFPLLRVIGRLYDLFATRYSINRLMGHVCTVFKKEIA